jgi:hypothetical protein
VSSISDPIFFSTPNLKGHHILVQFTLALLLFPLGCDHYLLPSVRTSRDLIRLVSVCSPTLLSSVLSIPLAVFLQTLLLLNLICFPPFICVNLEYFGQSIFSRFLHQRHQNYSKILPLAERENYLKSTQNQRERSKFTYNLPADLGILQIVDSVHKYVNMALIKNVVGSWRD